LEIKDILYQAIAEYDEKRIISDIAQGESSSTVDTIFEHCISNLEKNGQNNPEIRGSFAEGLTHYLLTVALIPSQRKTSLQSVDIDVAIPDTKTLSSSPEDAIVMLFPKTSEPQIIKNEIAKLKKIQPKLENIWVVVDKPLAVDAKVYSLDRNEFTFSNIINDLIGFSSNKKQSRLKIFKI
jgi:hypothetical protein